jgi:ribosomal protein S4
LRLRWFQKRFLITKIHRFKRRKLNLYRQSYRVKKLKNTSRIRYRKRVRFITNHSIALNTKYNIVKYFNSSFNIKLIKKDIKSLRLYTRFNFLKSILVRQLYKIDILLWRLKVCPSTAVARQLIFSKQITINDNYVKPTYFVKKGDIIKFFPYRFGFFLPHPKKIIKKKKNYLNLFKVK